MRCPECGGPAVHRTLPLPPEEIEVSPTYDVREDSADAPLEVLDAGWRSTPKNELEGELPERAPGMAHILDEDVCSRCGAIVTRVPG